MIGERVEGACPLALPIVGFKDNLRLFYASQEATIIT